MDALRRPTSTHYTKVNGIGMLNFIPHMRLFSETDGYIVNETPFIEAVLEDQLDPTDLQVKPGRST